MMRRCVGTVLWVVLTTIVVVSGGTRSAQACSCTLRDPLKALDDGNATFTGLATDVSFPDDEGLTEIEIVVDAVVRGDVPESITVFWELGTSCGGDPWPLLQQRILVTTHGSAERPRVGGCSHPAVIGAGTPILGTPPQPTSELPPVMLAVGTFGPADLVLLDASGEVISVAEIDGQVVDAAHCADTGRVVLQLLEPDRRVVFDLSGMAVVDEVGVSVDVASGGLACVNGGTVTIQRGGSGLVAQGAGERVERDLSGSAWSLNDLQTVSSPDGGGDVMVFVSRAVGGALEVVDAASLVTTAFVQLGPEEFVEDVAIDRTGSRIVVLVSDPARQDGLWQKSLVFLTFDGADLTRGSTVALDRLDPSDSFAVSIDWMDLDHVVVSSLDSLTELQRFDVVTTEGTPIANVDGLQPWPASSAVQDDVAWFVDGGTLTRLGVDGVEAPTALESANGSVSALIPLADVGTVRRQSVEPLSRSAPTARAAVTTSAVEQPAVDPSPAPSPDPWRWWIVGGVAIVTIIVAVGRRRRRRAGRS